MSRIIIVALGASLLFIGLLACEQETHKLPVIGFHDVVEGDTVYHRIPEFNFVNQDSQFVTRETFEGKAYVTDFFFTSCPTICPKLTRSMKEIYDEFEGREDLLLLSHSIDTRTDSVGRLKLYATNLGVTSDRWHFITGNKAEIFSIADEYYSVAKENPDAPGGYDHSGRLILVDAEGRIRSFCDGTDPEDVERFKEDIKILLGEEN